MSVIYVAWHQNHSGFRHILRYTHVLQTLQDVRVAPCTVREQWWPYSVAADGDSCSSHKLSVTKWQQALAAFSHTSERCCYRTLGVMNTDKVPDEVLSWNEAAETRLAGHPWYSVTHSVGGQGRSLRATLVRQVREFVYSLAELHCLLGNDRPADSIAGIPLTQSVGMALVD